jgi:hypothetical protein
VKIYERIKIRKLREPGKQKEYKEKVVRHYQIKMGQ